MGTYNPPLKAQAFTTRITVNDLSAVGTLRVNPTIASGDWKIDKDGGGFNNLGTLPTVDPAGGAAVKVVLSSTEMTADVVTILGVDQTSPKEWADFALVILTV